MWIIKFLFVNFDKKKSRLPPHSVLVPARMRDPFTRTHLLANVQTEELPNPQPAIEASIKQLVKHPAIKLLKPAVWALGEDMGITVSQPFDCDLYILQSARLALAD